MYEGRVADRQIPGIPSVFPGLEPETLVMIRKKNVNKSIVCIRKGEVDQNAVDEKAKNNGNEQ